MSFLASTSKSPVYLLMLKHPGWLYSALCTAVFSGYLKTVFQTLFNLTKARLVKAMFFPVVMYGCESWMIKKAEHQIIEAGEDFWESFGLQRDQSSQS